MTVSLTAERNGERSRLEPADRDRCTPPPKSNRGFQERSEVVFRAHGGNQPSWRDWRLLVDDAPLRLNEETKPGEWLWTPGFYAGEVEAAIYDTAGVRQGVWRLDVGPNPNKLSRDAFVRMLREISESDPALMLGTEPARRRFGALGENQNLIVEFYRLRHHAAAIGQSLRALTEEPIRSLRTRRSLSPPHLVRRADLRTARAALRQPALLAVVGAMPHSDLVGPGGHPQADIPYTERHYDNPPNRCLRYALRALQRRCASLIESLGKKAKESPSETKTSIAERWPEWERFLKDFQKRMDRASRRLPFVEVSKAEVTAAGLNAVAAHPLYARFWRVSWEALRPGVTGPKLADWLPLNPTWGLYETWCFVKLCRWLEEQLPELKWNDKSSTRSKDYRLLTGRSNDATLRLHFQRVFRNTGGNPKEFWSVSRERRPDIVLDWQRGDEHGFLVLDAKYVASRDSVLREMASAHIYNDSLCMHAARPAASLLLTPTSTDASWLETREFVDEHGSGVLVLHPDRELPEWFAAQVRLLIGHPGRDLALI